MKKFILVILLLTSETLFASSQNRQESVQAAKVWLAPAWINADFQFSPQLNVFQGPPLTADDQNLLKDPVTCTMNSKSMEKKPGGRTRKFYCELPQKNNSVIKVKYRFKNGEISGELFGTRLLWALGFAADRMYFINRLQCYGCTVDPWKDYRIDWWSLVSPRTFELVATERKFAGKEIKLNNGDGEYEGWSYSELMTLLPSDPAAKYKAQVEREALRLLSVFLMHGDNKDENQSLVCLGQTNKLGGCDGETVLMIHDLGATFGKGYDPVEASKTNLQDWSDSVIWADAKNCVARLGPNSAPEMVEPIIREEGRKFLAQLLRGFSEGAAGRERVKDIFRAGRGDLRSATIDQWAEVFLRKVDEINLPLGAGQPDFSCPQKFKVSE